MGGFPSLKTFFRLEPHKFSENCGEQWAEILGPFKKVVREWVNLGPPFFSFASLSLGRKMLKRAGEYKECIMATHAEESIRE